MGAVVNLEFADELPVTSSRMLDPHVVGEALRDSAPGAGDPATLQGTPDIILGMDERRGQGEVTGAQARALYVATVLCGRSVHWLARRVRRTSPHHQGFQGLCDGDYDHLPEAALYMVRTID